VITIFVPLLIVFLWAETAVAKDPVKARYLSDGGSEIRIELEIADPPPPLVIVMQKLPVGVGVVASSPELKKFDLDKGMAKWLLPKVSTGKMILTMKLDRQVQKGSVSGEVKCRGAAGAMISSRIAPSGS